MTRASAQPHLTTNEPTPVWDVLVTELGDPWQLPEVPCSLNAHDDADGES